MYINLATEYTTKMYKKRQRVMKKSQYIISKFVCIHSTVTGYNRCTVAQKYMYSKNTPKIHLSVPTKLLYRLVLSVVSSEGGGMECV